MATKILHDEYLLGEVVDIHWPKSVPHPVAQICSIYGEKDTQ